MEFVPIGNKTPLEIFVRDMLTIESSEGNLKKCTTYLDVFKHLTTRAGHVYKQETVCILDMDQSYFTDLLQ